MATKYASKEAFPESVHNSVHKNAREGARENTRKSTVVRKEQIARAALDIAAEHGVAGITAKRVAQRVGLAPSALYRHYKGKDEIIAAILEMVGERQRTNMAHALSMDDPMRALRWILDRVVEIISTHRALPLLFPSDEIWRGPQSQRDLARQGFENYTAGLAELMVRAQRKCKIRAELDPKCLLVLFVGLYMPPATLALRMPDKVDLGAQVEFNWQLFVRAVQP